MSLRWREEMVVGRVHAEWTVNELKILVIFVTDFEYSAASLLPLKPTTKLPVRAFGKHRKPKNDSRFQKLYIV